MTGENADSWGRPAPVPPRPPEPPDADPQGRYRPAAVGTHRTARWFILAGAVLLVLMVPLAVPFRSDSDGSGGPGSTFTMNDAAADVLEGWYDEPLDLSRWDSHCYATQELMPATMEADCGTVSIGLVSSTGVHGESTVVPSRRAMRAYTVTDTSDVPFHEEPADAALDPAFAGAVTNFRMTDVVPLSNAVRVPDFPDFPDAPGLPDGPGVPGGGSGSGPDDLQPVQYLPDGGGGGDDRDDAGGPVAVAASFLMKEGDGVLYTLTVTGTSVADVRYSTLSLLGGVRVAD